MSIIARVLALFFVYSIGYAQTDEHSARFNVHPLHLEKGPSGDLTFASVRDKDGFLWIATDNGLKRYDGYQFRTFRSDETDPTTIGVSAPNVLIEQQNGTLWAAGVNLNRYHPETESFTRYDISDQSNIRTITEDSQGLLWLGGEGFGLRAFDINEGEIKHTFFDKTYRGFISATTPHQNNHAIWVASRAGLYLFDTITHQAEDFKIPVSFTGALHNIRNITEDPQGNLWLAGQAGLLVINPTTRETKRYFASETPGDLKADTLRSVFKDSKGDIWVGTDKQGVHKYLPKTDSFLHIPASLSDHNAFPPGAIHHIHEDNTGNMWFSVARYGVYRISQHIEKFRVFRHDGAIDNSLSFDNILDLHEDKKGRLWIATDGGGLNRYDPHTKKFTHYKHDANNINSISNNSVLSIAEDDEGYIWLGTWAGGLNRLNPVTDEFIHFRTDPAANINDVIANDNVFRIHIDDDGLLYLSLWHAGLQTYNPKTKKFAAFFPHGQGKESGIVNELINDFIPASQNNYWLGGHRGLEHFDAANKSFRKIDIHGIESILGLYLDVKNILWIATSKGLIRYNPETDHSKFYTTQDGLADNFVLSIEEDEQGYLWFGTRRGLNRFNPRTEKFETFTENDGLASSQFNRYSHLYTKDKIMYFGGNAGLSYFNPSHLPKNTNTPKIYITNLLLSQTVVTPGKTHLLDKHINTIEKLILPYDQREITLEFSALNFISPEKNRYRYRLLGFDEEWIQTDSNRRRSHYTNLSPGKYIYQLTGSNNEGIWSSPVKELHLTILPPWWQTWWMRSIYGLLLVVIMYAFSYWRLRFIRLRGKRLKRLVGEKTTEILKQKRDLEYANHAITKLNLALEYRVEKRTSELLVEVEERKLAEEKLFHMAFHDPLTNLPNRAWLLDKLKQLLKRASTSNKKFALFFLDGDRFKQINDTHGHLLGDLLLQAAAKRLIDILPKEAHAIRLGGDEFTIIIDNVDSERQAKDAAQNIISSFEKPFFLEHIQMNFRVSIGILICGKQYSQPSQVLRDADIAMYRAKDIGRCTYQMFDSKMLEHTLATAAIEADLYKALKLKQFKVVFQPIIIIATGALSGFEALLRWHHPEKGLISPDKFIPIAEDLGLIYEIGLWVLEQACLQHILWSKESKHQNMPSMSVNLSTLQLGQPDFLPSIDQIFKKTNVDTRRIKLEITESTLMENTDIINKLLGALRERGIELAIDDFGTGYSSLTYLDKLPVQVLKIDQSFVSALIDNNEEAKSANEIVKATISLAHNLKIRVVAEGIETRVQRKILSDLKCDYGQGLLISPPLSARDATVFLSRSEVESLKNKNAEK